MVRTVLFSSPAHQSHFASRCSCIPATCQEPGYLATLSAAPAKPDWLWELLSLRGPSRSRVLKEQEEVGTTPAKAKDSNTVQAPQPVCAALVGSAPSPASLL